MQTVPRAVVRLSLIVLVLLALSPLPSRIGQTNAAAFQLPTPEQFLGFRVGEDRKLARWDKIVEYLNLADAAAARMPPKSSIVY